MVSRMRYGFLGCGNMASALAAGLGKVMDPASDTVLVTGRNPGRLEAFCQRFEARPVDREELARECGTVFLCVKPKDVPEALSNWPGNGLLVSVVAGYSLARLEELAGRDWRVIRTMPNTAVEVGQGVTSACSNQANPEDLDLVARLFSSMGAFYPIDENLMDAATAASGSGIAFVLALIEELESAGRQAGLPTEISTGMAIQTVAGAAALCQATGRSAAELRQAVTSPNGTTAAGLAALAELGFGRSIHGAVEAAALRSKELSRPS